MGSLTKRAGKGSHKNFYLRSKTWKEGRKNIPGTKELCFQTILYGPQGFPGGSVVKNLPAMQEMWAWSGGREDFLEKRKAAHSSILVWRIQKNSLVYNEYTYNIIVKRKILSHFGSPLWYCLYSDFLYHCIQYFCFKYWHVWNKYKIWIYRFNQKLNIEVVSLPHLILLKIQNYSFKVQP